MNLFSAKDHQIALDGLDRLSTLERRIVQLRFWNAYDVSEIAVELGVSTSNVRKTLTQALSTLMTHCLSSPDFSRAQSSSEVA